MTSLVKSEILHQVVVLRSLVGVLAFSGELFDAEGFVAAAVSMQLVACSMILAHADAAP